MMAMAASASVRRCAGVPSMKCDAQSIHSLDELGDQRPVRISAGGGETVGFEEQREDRIRLGSGQHRPRGANELGVVGCRRRERCGERLLEPEPHRHDHLGDQVVLRREVVHDDAVADPEALRQATEGELAETVVQRRRQGALEYLGLRVLVTHRT